MIYIQYPLRLKNKLILPASFSKILSAEWNDVTSCHGALRTKRNVNVFCNVLHHQRFAKALPLCSLERAGLCITAKRAGLTSPVDNPKAEPFLAVEPPQAVKSPFWEVFKGLPRQNPVCPDTVVLISTRGGSRRTPRGPFPSTSL